MDFIKKCCFRGLLSIHLLYVSSMFPSHLINWQAVQFVQLCFKLLKGGEVRRYGGSFTIGSSRLSCFRKLPGEAVSPIISSTPRQSMSVCSKACSAWNLTVRVCWRTCLQTRTDAFTHMDKHMLKLGNWAHEAKEQDRQNLPSCLCAVRVCASGFLCFSSNALAHFHHPKTRQFPVKPSDCDSCRCLMGKA